MVQRYQKGARFERKLVNRARKEGKIAFRSAGSHSPIDVCIIDTESKIIRFIQAKAGKHSKKSLNRLKALLQQHNGIYLVKFELEEK